MKHRTIRRSFLLVVLIVFYLGADRPAFAEDPGTGSAQAEESVQQKSAEEQAATLRDLHKSKQWEKEKAFVDELLAGDPQLAANVFSRVLRDRTIESRTHIISRIEREKLLWATGILVELLQTPDEDESIRSWCVSALGAMKESPWASYHLQRVLVSEHDKQKNVRISLARLGEPYLQYYLSGLADIDRERRVHAIRVLEIIEDARAVPALVQRLDSREPWESGFAGDAITQITGIPSAIITQTTTRPDGSVSTQGKRRPSEEFKQDCEAWLAENHELVSKPIEKSLERWIPTPEKPLYTQLSDVLYKGMPRNQVESLLVERRLFDLGSKWKLSADSKGNTLTIFTNHRCLLLWKVHEAAEDKGEKIKDEKKGRSSLIPTH